MSTTTITSPFYLLNPECPLTRSVARLRCSVYDVMGVCIENGVGIDAAQCLLKKLDAHDRLLKKAIEEGKIIVQG